MKFYLDIPFPPAKKNYTERPIGTEDPNDATQRTEDFPCSIAISKKC
jgi:hypothetical protein